MKRFAWLIGPFKTVLISIPKELKMRTTLRTVSGTCVLVLIACLLTSFISSARADGSKDTPERLMELAGPAISSTNPANRFFTALAKNRAFAKEVLDAAKAENKGALTQLVAKGAAINPNRVTIDEVDRDMLVKFRVTLENGKIVSGCIDTEARKRCGGGNVSVSYTET